MNYLEENFTQTLTYFSVKAIFVSLTIYTYIFVKRERERETDRQTESNVIERNT